MRALRVGPAVLSALGPKSSASANSATLAFRPSSAIRQRPIKNLIIAAAASADGCCGKLAVPMYPPTAARGSQRN